MSRILHEEARVRTADPRRRLAAGRARTTPAPRMPHFLTLNAYFTSIGGGTDQIQRNIIPANACWACQGSRKWTATCRSGRCGGIRRRPSLSPAHPGERRDPGRRSIERRLQRRRRWAHREPRLDRGEQLTWTAGPAGSLARSMLPTSATAGSLSEATSGTAPRAHGSSRSIADVRPTKHPAAVDVGGPR